MTISFILLMDESRPHGRPGTSDEMKYFKQLKEQISEKFLSFGLNWCPIFCLVSELLLCFQTGKDCSNTIIKSYGYKIKQKTKFP